MMNALHHSDHPRHSEYDVVRARVVDEDLFAFYLDDVMIGVVKVDIAITPMAFFMDSRNHLSSPLGFGDRVDEPSVRSNAGCPTRTGTPESTPSSDRRLRTRKGKRSSHRRYIYGRFVAGRYDPLLRFSRMSIPRRRRSSFESGR